jgi:hypothetical protein
LLIPYTNRNERRAGEFHFDTPFYPFILAGGRFVAASAKGSRLSVNWQSY